MSISRRAFLRSAVAVAAVLPVVGRITEGLASTDTTWLWVSPDQNTGAAVVHFEDPVVMSFDEAERRIIYNLMYNRKSLGGPECTLEYSRGDVEKWLECMTKPKGDVGE